MGNIKKTKVVGDNGLTFTVGTFTGDAQPNSVYGGYR